MIQEKRPKKDLTKVLGPVESLEYYVKADWWKEIFNANYLRTDGDVVDDLLITQSEVSIFINTLNIQENHYVLDLCCGQGRHSMELARKGIQHVFGLDRSHYLVNRARKQSKTEGLSVNFKEGDARNLPYRTDTFDFVIIPGNSFGYFEAIDDDYKVLKEVKRVLKPQGKILLDITDGDYIRQNFEARSWEWIDKNYFVCRERSLSKDQEKLVSREVITHTKKGVIADQFYAERLYTPQSIADLLTKVGFIQVEVHHDLEVTSQRNQDLGMMAKRIILTAEVDKAWSPAKKATKTKRKIAVLLGDPRIDDSVKPNGTFDEDDYHTINALKEALKGLSEYEIAYYDQHRNLINYLQNNRQKIDFIFNLCDEGYNNEATKELHVPALLEIFQIPYSGGNPQCLAYCYDKSLIRGVAKELDLPVPEAFVIKPENTTFIEFPLQFPVIVKPNFGDSSIGITRNSVCYDIVQLEESILKLREQFGYETIILVEQFLTGKDISLGIIGNLPDDYLVLPVIEEDYSGLPADLPRICGYEAKWDFNTPYSKIKSIPADLPEETNRFLVASCLKLFGRLSCRDYARFDWRLDKNGTPRLLEVNPNPGWCWDGHLAKMAEIAGISYQEMLQKILKSAEMRIFKER